MTDDILLQVNKPARYIGKEWNIPKKDFDGAKVKFALCFPDLYEVGMSNLGFRIIYDILNNQEYAGCERFFSPDVDMERLLREKQKRIVSLETARPLKDFDIVGFSLSYELNYTNALNILDLGGIPVLSVLRDESYPLVIAGGPCVSNPEPMHEYFDLFVFGEGEEVILEIISVYKNSKNNFKKPTINKRDLLIELAKIEGVYVPAFYNLSYNSDGSIKEFSPLVKNIPSVIKKRIIRDLDQIYSPQSWLVPYIQVIHDRVQVELMRGCPNRCRFCQARSYYFPFRIRSNENVLRLAKLLYECTGYDEVSLGGLSVSDYPDLEKNLESLICIFKDKAVSISLPSVRPKTMLSNVSALIAGIKKTGLTFAPEAGSARLRKIIGKDFSDDELLEVALRSYASGYQHLKLYFMIGLPLEENADLDAIFDLAVRVSEARRKINKGSANINISINTLIPKPHTPFQWLAMETADSIKQKQDYLKKKMIRNKKIKFSFHNLDVSFLEGILSRGDRNLSRVIYSAYKKGARFDAWQDRLRLDLWLEAFKECKIDPNFYLREKSAKEYLPWEFLDTGISQETFKQDYDKIIAIKEDTLYTK